MTTLVLDDTICSMVEANRNYDGTKALLDKIERSRRISHRPVSEAIAWLGEDIAKSEAQAEAWQMVRAAMDHGASPVAALLLVRRRLTEQVLGYPEDTSSGRFHNPIQRSKFDGYRDFIRNTEYYANQAEGA